MGNTMMFREDAPSPQHSSSDERPPEAPGQMELKLESTQAQRPIRVVRRPKPVRLFGLRVRKLGADRRDDLSTMSER